MRGSCTPYGQQGRSVPRPWLWTGDHFAVLTKRRLVSDTPNPLRAQTKPKTTTSTLRGAPITPRRGAPREVQRGCSGRQPRAHVLEAIQCTHAHPARNRQSGGRCSAEPSLQSFPWTQLDVLFWREGLAGAASSTLVATHHRLPTHPKAPMADCRPPAQHWQGSEQNRTGHRSLLF